MKSQINKQSLQNHHLDLNNLVKIINENYLFLKTTWLLSISKQTQTQDQPHLIINYYLPSKILKLKLSIPQFQIPWTITTKLQNPVLTNHFLAKLAQFDQLIKLYQLSHKNLS